MLNQPQGHTARWSNSFNWKISVTLSGIEPSAFRLVHSASTDFTAAYPLYRRHTCTNHVFTWFGLFILFVSLSLSDVILCSLCSYCLLLYSVPQLHILKEIARVVCSLPAIFSANAVGRRYRIQYEFFLLLFCKGEDNDVIKLSVSFFILFRHAESQVSLGSCRP
jgi:hypothetical protein